MNDYVLIDENSITEPELRALVENLAGLKHANVAIHTQWLVYSDDAALMVALDALLGTPLPVVTRQPKVKATKEPGTKRLYKTHAGGKGKGIQVSVAGEHVHIQETVAPAIPTETKQIHSWEIHIPGITGKTTDPIEKITIDEKNRRLAAGLFETGTLLRHPKAGFSRVLGAKGTGQGMESISTTDAIKILDA